MRIARLDLIAYGPFRGKVLDLSRPGIHVVFGRNEAGKSTSLRAITGLLYGIDRQTQDAHVHKTTDLRIGGVIEADGVKLEVVRRKGNTNTLLDAAGAPVPEAALRQLTGGVTQETFRHAFGLERLVIEAGARALLEGKGDLGESLFDASVGGGGEVQRLLAELTSEADAIYRPRATSLPLNEALKSFGEAQRRVRETQSLPEAFLEQERGLEAEVRERDACVAERRRLAERRDRIERARRRLPQERRRDRATAELAAAGPLAGEVPRIEALRDRFVAYEQALDRAARYAAGVERLGEQIAIAAERAGVTPDRVVRIESRTEGRIHGLLRERTALSEKCGEAAIEIARLEREVARADETNAAAAPDERADLLAAPLERARALGDVEGRIVAERAKLDRRHAELERRARALGAPLDVLTALRVPAIETVERVAARDVELARREALASDRIASLEDEASRIERQVAGQTGDFAPPDAAALAAARTARDRAWDAVRGAEPAVRAAAEVELERLLREADAVADRMIREADRVTSLARLRSEAAENARQTDRARADREQLGAARAALRAELREAWEAPVAPLDLPDVAPWLARHRQLAEDHAALVEARAELTASEDAAARARSDLAAALGSEPGPSSRTLADLVALAGRARERTDGARRERAAAARALAETRALLDDRLARRAHDVAALAAAAARLAEVTAPLGIAGDAPPEEVTRAIESLRELFKLVDDRAQEEARARSAAMEARAFESDLARAITELAPDLSARPPREAAPLLFARGQAAKAAAHDRRARRSDRRA